MDQEDRLGRVLQGCRQGGVHGYAERTVVLTGLRTGLGCRQAGMRALGLRQKVMRVADLNRAHNGDEEDRYEGKQAHAQ